MYIHIDSEYRARCTGDIVYSVHTANTTPKPQSYESRMPNMELPD